VGNVREREGERAEKMKMKIKIKIKIKRGCRLRATRVFGGRCASPEMGDRIWDIGGA